MKILKALSLTAVLLILLTSFTTLVGDSPYVGRWKGEAKSNIGFLELTSDGYAVLEFNGSKMGGKSYYHDGKELAMTYQIDDKQSPVAIDLIRIDKSDDTEVGRLKGILETKSKDQLHIALGFGREDRPTDYTTGALLFSRVK
ncbi:hypothetical protein FNJ87_05315 [Nonlabens mediterrranea]|uniref:Uncharacterized protein n=1 Tax=Nonlabens mediterrranea TaxID=1419947 RepID=A0ABS0A336_9FLAO|nr:hypothetical protein [Nonlabens mediterrranea]